MTIDRPYEGYERTLLRGGAQNEGLYVLHNKDMPDTVVLKLRSEQLTTSKDQNRRLVALIMQNLRYLQRVSTMHDNLLTIREIFGEQKEQEQKLQVCVYADYYNGGDLVNHMERVTCNAKAILKPSFAQMCQLMVGLWNGMLCLHKNHVRHGDLKPENIFVRFRSVQFSSGYEAVIGDLDAIGVCDNAGRRVEPWPMGSTTCYTATPVWDHLCDTRPDQAAMLLITLEFLSSDKSNFEEMDWFEYCKRGVEGVAEIGMIDGNNVPAAAAVPESELQQLQQKVVEWLRTYKKYVETTLQVIKTRSVHISEEVHCNPLQKATTSPKWDYDDVTKAVFTLLKAEPNSPPEWRHPATPGRPRSVHLGRGSAKRLAEEEYRYNGEDSKDKAKGRHQKGRRMVQEKADEFTHRWGWGQHRHLPLYGPQ